MERESFWNQMLRKLIDIEFVYKHWISRHVCIYFKMMAKVTRQAVCKTVWKKIMFFFKFIQNGLESWLNNEIKYRKRVFPSTFSIKSNLKTFLRPRNTACRVAFNNSNTNNTPSWTEISQNIIADRCKTRFLTLDKKYFDQKKNKRKRNTKLQNYFSFCSRWCIIFLAENFQL